MQNPDDRAPDTRIRETGLIPAEPLERAGVEPIPDAHPVYVKEPLFNKKVMLVWALGAAAVWFAVSFIKPMVVESAKSSIREAVQEAETNTGQTITIRRSRDGKVFTITREPVPTVPAEPAAKAPPATTATPPAPVATPQPEPAKRVPDAKR